jgi:hypothetical protein
MEIREPTPPAIGKFRYRLHRSFHRSWLYLLNCGASYYANKLPEDNSYLINTLSLRQENKRYQEEISRFFAPFYQACLPCKSSCCIHMETPPPVMVLDYLLFGISDTNRAHINNINFKIIVNKVTKLFTIRNNQIINIINHVRCPRLNSKGCSLAWGQRPVACVIRLCPNFSRFMTWQEYWGFMVKCTSYLFFLTNSFHKLSRYTRMLSSA